MIQALFQLLLMVASYATTTCPVCHEALGGCVCNDCFSAEALEAV
jgi:hypothetical protein